MTETEFDKLLRKALMETVWQDFRPAIEAAEYEQITYSERYLKRRERLLEDPFGYAKKMLRTPLQRVARTAAMILLVCSILFAMAMSIPQVRAAIKRLYMEWYETHIAVYVQESTDSDVTDLSVFHVEIPSEVLPEGYREIVRLGNYGIVRYENEDGDNISVDYWYTKGDNLIGINNLEMADRKQIIDGIEYCIFEALGNHNANQVMWIDTECNLLVKITAPSIIDMTDLLNIGLHTIVHKK